MRSIEVADGTHEHIRLLARAWDTSEADVVRRLLDAFAGPDNLPAEPDTADVVGVYAVHDGNRIEGSFNRRSHKLEITSGRLAGQAFKSPSGAATAVVRAHSPRVTPNRNGWVFWTVSETGELLHTLRRSHRPGGRP